MSETGNSPEGENDFVVQTDDIEIEECLNAKDKLQIPYVSSKFAGMYRSVVKWLIRERQYVVFSFSLKEWIAGPDAKALIEDWFRSRFEPHFTTNILREFHKNLQNLLRVKSDDFWCQDPEIRRISNGFLDLRNQKVKFKSMSDRRFTNFAIAHPKSEKYNQPYDPTALMTHSATEKFYRRAYPRERDFTMRKRFGGYLYHGNQKEKKNLFVYGPANTGKDIDMEVTIDDIGRANCSFLGVEELCTDRFGSSDLDGSILNVVDEPGHMTIKTAELFKKYFGGSGIAQRMQRKGQPAHDAVIKAKHLSFGNTVPQFQDVDEATLDRILLCQTGPSIPKAEQRDRDELLKELLTPHEKSVRLNWYLDGLKELWAGKGFADEDADTTWEMYQRVSNPVVMFIHDFCDINEGEDDPTYTISQFYLHDEFVKFFVKRFRKSAWSKGRFEKELKIAWPHISMHRPDTGNDAKDTRSTWMWVGLKSKYSDSETPRPDDTKERVEAKDRYRNKEGGL